METLAERLAGPDERRRLPRTRVAVGRHGMVATAASPATCVAREVLESGGNAVDAAVAAAWALSVCEPSGSGLGGQTTLLVRHADGRTAVIDGHSYAPRAASTRTVSAAQQKYGHRACTVPSTPAVLGAALARFGSLRADRAMEPAITLASEGFATTPLLRRQIRWCLPRLQRCPYATRVFLHRGGPPEVGHVVRQPVLAGTLERIAREGVDDFYSGQLARAIVEDVRRNDGLLDMADLADYAPRGGSDVLSIIHQGYTVMTAPPPAGGLLLLQALRVIDRMRFSEASVGSAAWHGAVAEVVRTVFHDRARRPVHPDSFTEALLDLLTSDDYAERMARRARRRIAPPAADVTEEPGETTHLCVADPQGTVVSLTQSIQSLFGAKVANAGLGFFYNNYLCTCPRRAHPHGLGSRALPRSNGAPTIAVRRSPRGGGPRLLALGAAGSRRIISALLQVLGNRIDRGMTLSESIDAPRLHAMLNGKVLIESGASSPSLTRRLSRRFRRVVTRAPRSYSMGAVQALELHDDGHWVGAADPRREGTADGF